MAELVAGLHGRLQQCDELSPACITIASNWSAFAVMSDCNQSNNIELGIWKMTCGSQNRLQGRHQLSSQTGSLPSQARLVDQLLYSA